MVLSMRADFRNPLILLLVCVWRQKLGTVICLDFYVLGGIKIAKSFFEKSWFYK